MVILTTLKKNNNNNTTSKQKYANLNRLTRRNKTFYITGRTKTTYKYMNGKWNIKEVKIQKKKIIIK